MGAVTFKSLQKYGERLGVKVEKIDAFPYRYRVTHEKHGGYLESSSLDFLEVNINKLSIGNPVNVSAQAEIIAFSGDGLVRVRLHGYEIWLPVGDIV